jgi:hypothetical protein
MLLPFEAGAADELEAAALWYEREREGYGRLLVSEVARSVARAARLPDSGAIVAELAPERDVRRFAVRTFPYSVVTALVLGRRTVIAVAHHRRAPGYWRERLG